MSVAMKGRESEMLQDFDQWMQWSSSHFSKSNSARDSKCDFSAEVSAWSYGPVELSWTSFFEDQTASYTRGPSEISADPREHFELITIVRGDVELEQGGRRTLLTGGDCAIYEQASPFSLRFRGECETIFLNVPSSRILRRWPDAIRLTALRVAGSSKFGGFVSTMLRELVELDLDTETACQAGLGHSITDSVLASLELDLRGHLADSGGDSKLLVLIKKFALANLSNPDLSIDNIASSQGISRSTLNRLFATEATTPMKWVWEQRLASCHDALATGRVKQITSLAFDHGFNDLSHFSRSFRAKYGCSPRSMLRP